MLSEALKKKAEMALTKKPVYGLDLDVSEFEPKHVDLNVESLDSLDEELSSSMESVGLSLSEKSTLGGYIQVDQTSIYSLSRKSG
ncbi:MAG: hypothetical protein QXG12_07705, partial [Thermoproteota archaeon]